MRSHLALAVVIVLLSIVPPEQAEAFGHYWSQGFGYGRCGDVATDLTGNVVVFGEYDFTIDFGGGPLPTAGLYGDACLAKFTSSGTHVWSKQIGGFDAQFARFVRVDAGGNVFIAGEFVYEIDIDGTVHSTIGSVDIFLAKLDPNGNRIWSRSFGNNPGSMGITGLGLDNLGNVYLEGWGGDIDYGGGLLSSDSDVHVVKFDSAGNHVWSYGYGHPWPSLASPRSMAVDPAGNVLITGDFDGSVDFGGATLTSVGGDDIFLARFDTNGAHQWSKGFGDGGSHPAQTVATDNAGNAYLIVDLVGTINFGGGSLTSAGLDDIFLAKFAPNGNHQWSKRFGDSDEQSASAMTVTPAGEIYLAGANPTGVLDFGAGPPLSNGSFLARLTPAGTHISSQDFGNFCTPRAVAVNPWGHPVMAGDKHESTDFGGGPVAQIGSLDIFLVKFAPSATAIPYVPEELTLGLDASPNPFNPSTAITYTVPEAGPVSIRVFDASGRLVEHLVESERHDAGRYTLNYRPNGASGVYFVRMDAGGRFATRKIVLLK